MPMLRIENFGGMVPLQDDHLLQQYHASFSQNANVQAGSLSCLCSLIPLHTVTPGMRAFFRIPKISPRIDNMIDSYWLEFPNENTWVVRNPTPGVDRFYWADGNQPGYTTRDRVIAGQPPLHTGIPAPAVAPGVTVTGGTTPVVTRAYVYTWVSAYYEEGQPSPPTVVSGNLNGVWHITMTAPTSLDTANRNLAYTNIYRTITNQQGVATFFFVAQVPITTLTYDDVIPDSTTVLNDELQSVNWLIPPQDLNGLVNMPNGMIAGFRHNEVWFCEPYRPHAWPPQYVLTVESEIVGLGVQQQSLVICTVGWTYVATGLNPSNMTLTKVANLEPCTSMGSIVSAPEGVLYTSVNGLIVCSSGTEVNATANLVRKDEWPKLLYLPALHAAYINRSYFAMSSPSDGVFQIDTFQVPTAAGDPLGAYETIDYSGTRDGAFISISDERTAFMKVHVDEVVVNVLQDVWTGELLILMGGVVYHVDIRQIYPRLTYRWRSKLFQTPYKENWAAAKVFFDLPPGVPPDVPTYFRFFADGRKVFDYELKRSGEQFRLPSGYKSDMVQFELEGQLVVYNVQIATSARELRQR